jgi:hypothetical protein
VDDKTGEVHPCRRKVSSNNWQFEAGWNKPVIISKTETIDLKSSIVMGFNLYPMIAAHWTFSAQRHTRRFRKYSLKVHAVIDPDTVIRLFKDRSKTRSTTTSAGKRRPILHWSSSHFRKLYDTPRNWFETIIWRWFPRFRRVRKVVPVKTHLRGLKAFECEGLECSIVVPGRMPSEMGLVGFEGKPLSKWFDPTGDEAISDTVFPGKGSEGRKAKRYTGQWKYA